MTQRQKHHKSLILLVPGPGIEPGWGCPREILSRLSLRNSLIPLGRTLWISAVYAPVAAPALHRL